MIKINDELLKSIEVDYDFINKVSIGREYNENIISYHRSYYFELLSKDNKGVKSKNFKEYKSLLTSSYRIDDCNKYWLIDKYQKQKIKDFKKTNLCRNKFCSNCKKVKQASRMAKYIPLLEPYSDKLYHLTLTIPNVPGNKLKTTIKKMFDKFKRLIKIIYCDFEIVGLDFSQYGFEGALRSLEVTFKDDSYHPHFHIALILNKADLERKHVNKFSYKYGKLSRQFSDLEILIQKIWRLLMTDKRITKSNIDNLELGYSCTLDKFEEGHYAELFKYLTKDLDEESNQLTYSNFKVLYDSLKSVRQIQGYGCLYNIKDNTDDELEKIEDLYHEIVKELKEKEEPVEVCETPEELLLNKDYKVISKKRIYSYIKNL